jgi:peroxiredoxin
MRSLNQASRYIRHDTSALFTVLDEAQTRGMSSFADGRIRCDLYTTRMDDHLVPLPPGALAPDFTLPQTLAATLSLHHLAGIHVILVFYPTVYEPVSGEQLTLYQEFLSQLRSLDAEVVGISTDDAWRHEVFAREAGVRFPLLSDSSPRGVVSRRYGVYREREQVSARALFLLDRTGTIRFSQAYRDLLNPGVDDVLTMLEARHAEEHRLQHRVAPGFLEPAEGEERESESSAG